MHSKFMKLGSWFLAGTLASLGAAAHADEINTNGVMCQNFNAREVQDIDYVINGVRNIDTSFSRQIICTLPRAPLATAATPLFFVDGQNDANTSTTCTLYISSYFGVVTQSLTFTESGGPSPPSGRRWDHAVTFPLNSVLSSDYASLLCELPSFARGTIFGVTSVQ